MNSMFGHSTDLEQDAAKAWKLWSSAKFTKGRIITRNYNPMKIQGLTIQCLHNIFQEILEDGDIV